MVGFLVGIELLGFEVVEGMTVGEAVIGDGSSVQVSEDGC